MSVPDSITGDRPHGASSPSETRETWRFDPGFVPGSPRQRRFGWRGKSRLGSIQSFTEVLSLAECDRVLDAARLLAFSPGEVSPPTAGARACAVATLLPDSENVWLFERMETVFVEAADCYGYEVTGLGEGIQLISYTEGNHFDWHTDLAVVDGAVRKISASVQLTTAADYAGGGLEFFGLGEIPGSRARGSAIVFPSFTQHRVSAVRQGVRWALVAWAVGPAFR